MSRWVRVLIALTAAASGAFVAPVLAQQTRDVVVSARGTSTITGLVVSDESGRPVGRALVTVTGIAPAFAELASTDAEGRFTFTALPAGDLTITAAKTTYLTAYFGAHDPIRGPAAPMTIKSGAAMNVTLRLIRGAVVAGVVTGPTGRPQPGAQVSAHSSRLVGGARRVVQSPRGHGGVTDDKGRYRIWGLAPGDYVIEAAPSNAQTSARATSDADIQAASATTGGARAPAPPPSPIHEVRFAPLYYPNAVDPGQALDVALRPGEERDGVDISLRPITTADIHGTITGLDGQPAAQMTVALDGALDHVASISDAAGRFSFRSVAPGTFTLSARGRVQTSPNTQGPDNLWASTEISVNGENLDSVALVLQKGMTASGRIAFDGAPPAAGSRAVVNVAPVDDRSATARVVGSIASANGTFALRDLAPGQYVLRPAYTGSAGASGSWLAKSVMWQGQDLLDGTLDIAPGQDVSGLTVVFSDRQTDLRGTFFDSAGHPIAGYDVVVFAADRRFWTPGSRRIQHVVLGHDGHFDFSGLPAGDYLLAAVTHADPDDLADPDWLDGVAPLTLHVTLSDGEHKIQDIRLGK